MKNPIVIGVLALVVGLGGGFATAQLLQEDDTKSHSVEHSHEDGHDKMEHEGDGHDHGHMEHEKIEVSADEAPTVSLEVVEDEKSGWNVKVTTTNFTFAPENVNGDHVLGEGHAHLYVDGKKVSRLYGPNFHYDGSFDGTKTFKVTLNANDHSEYAVDGQVISAEQEVTHEAHEEGEEHGHHE